MHSKPEWKQPKLIQINPFGGANVNPYEFHTFSSGYLVVFTGGLGHGTTLYTSPGGLVITDFDNSPGDSIGNGLFYVSSIAPIS